jgi:hypothetical protein
MKKIVLCLMVAFLSLAFIPLQSKAATTEEPSSLPAPKPAESTKLILTSRLDEIKATDKSKLNSEERRFTKSKVNQT